jgi:hypothetical protein
VKRGEGCIRLDAHSLPFSGVQHKHGIFANGYGGVVAVGEAWDDAAVADFADDCGAACSAGGEYFVSWTILRDAISPSLGWPKSQLSM